MPLSDNMPTAAKLIGAIGLAAVGWFASEAIRPLMPPHTDFGWFNQVNVALGLICGWRVLGKRVGGGFSEAISAGLTGAAALVFWGVFVQAFNQMLDFALEKKYDGPFEGIIGVFNLMLEFGANLLDAKVIGIIVIGGLLTGILADRVARRYG